MTPDRVPSTRLSHRINAVPSRFFKLSKRLIKACPDDWIITPNERLAREFSRAYDAHQIGLGKRAWASPRVASIDRFIATRAADSLPLADRRSILAPEAELLLWQELGGRDRETLSETAADAWRLVHGYRILLDDSAFAGTINARTFRRWARRFRERLKLDGTATRAELADLLPGAADRLHLVAFDVLSPQVTDFLRRTERAGGAVRHHRPLLMRKGPHKRVEITDRGSEIHAAAQWARHVLTRYPAARIGVVFPYLTDAYHAIAHAFETEFADAPQALNISGGVPLAEQPIWRDAELLLRLVVGEVSHRELERLRHSSWLDLGGPLRLSGDSPDLLRLHHVAPASEVLGRLALSARELPRRQAFGRWVEAFRSLLAGAGWNGSMAASGQYQAYLRLRECLDRFSGFSELPGLSGMDALQTVQRLLANRLFAPERPPGPVQVLGYLETAGLAFTHLWVAGLKDTAWPAAPTPNPLIPVPLQRLHGVPRADHALEAAFAVAQTHRWRRACRYLVTSHALDDSEESHRCSSLVESVPVTALGRLVPRFRARRHPWLATPQAGGLEAVDDGSGSPVDGVVTRGGTSLFRDQAQCPFRAWAIHRIGLGEIRHPQSFPDALERGTLIHDALFVLYEDGPDPVSESRIEAAASRAVNKHLERVPELYRRNERRRLRRLLETWAQYNAERPEFSIVGLEQKTELTLPGFQLSLRIDRIDRDPRTDARVVMDYKTGNVNVSGLLGERLTEPQLPMYALCDAGVRATLYARLGSRGVALGGIASEDIELGPARVRRLSREDWRHLTDRWRAGIESLAREFREGHATVTPTSRSVCDHCHLPSFCRIRAAGTPEGAAEAAPDSTP